MENNNQNETKNSSGFNQRKTETGMDYNYIAKEADITDMMAHGNEEQQKSVEEEKYSYKSFFFVLFLGFVSGLLTFGLVLCCTALVLPKPTEQRKTSFILGVVVGLVTWLIIGVTVYLIVVGHQFTGTLG